MTKTKKPKTIKEFKELTQDLKNKIVALEDENKLLWNMLDEMRESDIKNYSEMLEEITRDALTAQLMVSTTKGEA
jgi:hypothetical protein|tara:strand:+ start:6231 stop:6455 length:225 start_codon:yes stop_codon:yes gene_type:complete